MSIQWESAANLIYLFFSIGCHQLPERSLFLFGHKLAVCARCSAIYFGFLTTTLFYPLLKKRGNKKTPGKQFLIYSLIPLGLDGVTQLLTPYESTNLIRAVTGGIFGIILPFYIIPAYNTIVYEAADYLKKYGNI